MKCKAERREPSGVARILRAGGKPVVIGNAVTGGLAPYRYNSIVDTTGSAQYSCEGSYESTPIHAEILIRGYSWRSHTAAGIRVPIRRHQIRQEWTMKEQVIQPAASTHPIGKWSWFASLSRP